MRGQQTPLAEIIDGWPSSATTLEDLANLPKEMIRAELGSVDEDTREAVWALRAQARALVRATQIGGDSLHSPKAILEAFRQGRLKPRSDYWTVYPLGTDHRRISAPYKPGGGRYLVKVTSKFPRSIEEIELGEIEVQHMRYLVIWTGNVDVLSMPDVVERIVTFGSHALLADVIFWNPEVVAMYSLRFGFGDHDGEKVGFPDEVAKPVEMARAVWHAKEVT